MSLDEIIGYKLQYNSSKLIRKHSTVGCKLQCTEDKAIKIDQSVRLLSALGRGELQIAGKGLRCSDA
jgi:hypothetical protein